MVRSVFVSHNNKGRQRVYLDSHYLDNIDNNAVIINVHLCSHLEQFGCERYMLARCVRQQHCLTTYESSAVGADDQR
jgi:hypothetical protein